MSSLPIGRMSFQSVVRTAKAGDERAVERLLTEPGPLRGLVAKIKRQVDPNRLAQGWEPMPQSGKPDEADAAARVGILQALAAFDPDRGVRFTTFAYPFILRAVIEAIHPAVRRAKDDRPVPVLVEFRTSTDEEAAGAPTESELLDRDPGYGLDAAYVAIFRREQRAAVRRFTASLPDNQGSIVQEIYFEERTQDEIASARGVSRQAISKALNKALARGRRDLADLDLVAA